MAIESESPEIQNIELSETNFKMTMLNTFYKVKDKLKNINELEFCKYKIKILEFKNIINKLIQKYIWKCKRPKIAKMMEEQSWRLELSHFETIKPKYLRQFVLVYSSIRLNGVQKYTQIYIYDEGTNTI